MLYFYDLFGEIIFNDWNDLNSKKCAFESSSKNKLKIEIF